MTTDESTHPTRATALCAAMQAVGGGLGWSLVPPLLPLIATDVHLSHAQAGLVWGATPLGIALAAPLGGAAVDRFGPRRVAGLAMLAGALACAARAFVTDALGLGLAMFAFGLHVAFTAPAIPKALVAHVPLARLGRANGTALLSYTLGTAVTVLIARTVLVPLFGGWRPTMIAAAVAMALTGVVWLVLVRDRASHARHAGLFDVLRLGRDGQLLRVAAMQFLLFGGYLALLGILPRALTDAGLAPERVGIVVGSWLVAAGVANLAGPWLSDRIGLRRPLLVAGGAIAGLALGALVVLPASAATPALLVAALGGGAVAPLLFCLPLEIPTVGPSRAGAAMGLLMLVGQAGGFLLPALSGAAVEAGGFAAGLGLLAVAHLAILVPARGLRETGRGAWTEAPVAG